MFQDIADEMYEQLKKKKIASFSEKDFGSSLNKLRMVSPAWVKFSEWAIQLGLHKGVVSIAMTALLATLSPVSSGHFVSLSLKLIYPNTIIITRLA